MGASLPGFRWRARSFARRPGKRGVDLAEFGDPLSFQRREPCRRPRAFIRADPRAGIAVAKHRRSCLAPRANPRLSRRAERDARKVAVQVQSVRAASASSRAHIAWSPRQAKLSAKPAHRLPCAQLSTNAGTSGNSLRIFRRTSCQLRSMLVAFAEREPGRTLYPTRYSGTHAMGARAPILS